MRTATAEEFLDRGVWKECYLSTNGYEVIFAVTRQRKCIKRIELRPGVSEELAAAYLEALLDRTDPVPRLRLVRPDPAAPTPYQPAELLLLARHGYFRSR